MKMASKWGLLGLAMLLAAAPVMAQDGASPSILKVVPGDAWGFVAVRSLEDLNTEFLGLAKRLNLPMFGPGGIIESPLLALKAQLGLNAGFDDKGSLAVAILAGESFDDIDQRPVVFVPSSDIKALTDPLGAESAGDDDSVVTKIVGKDRILHVRIDPARLLKVGANDRGVAKKILGEDKLPNVRIDLSGLPEVDADDVNLVKKILGKDGLLHLSITLSSLPEVDAEDVSVIKKILGQDGLLFRVAAASPKHLAITMGGGKSRAEKIIDLCKKGGAPLADRPGIKLVNKSLPKSRQGELYIAVDQILALVKSVARAFGEDDDLPFNLRKINAPVAVVTSNGANFGRVDIFLPTQLIQQLGQAAMTAMMMGG